MAWLPQVVAIAALALSFTSASLAQTTSSTDVRNFEVIAVDGNKLVFRDERGTNEITVPDDFRFTVDGKKLSVSELKAGMKGTAAVTTKTTITPVTVTEVREAVVLRVSDMSVNVRMADGVSRRFTRGDLDKRGIQLVMNGKPIQMSELRRGDKLTATVISAGPPQVLSEKEVQMMLDPTAPEPVSMPAQTAAAPAPASPAPTTTAAAQPAPAPAPTAATAPVQATSVQPAAPAAPAPATASTATTSTASEGSGFGAAWLVALAIIVIGTLVIVSRSNKKPA